MAAQAEALGLDLHFIEAVDGRSLSERERAAYQAWRRGWTWRAAMTPNEIACVHSHRKAMQAFLASGAPVGMVLEDDAALAPEIMTVAAEVAALAPAWDLVRFCAAAPQDAGAELAALPSGRRLVMRRKWTLWAVATLYHRASAERFLAGSARFFEAFDNLQGRPWVAGGYVLELDRPAAGPTPGAPSTLETAESRAPAATKRMRGWWRFTTSLHRAVMGPIARRRLRGRLRG